MWAQAQLPRCSISNVPELNHKERSEVLPYAQSQDCSVLQGLALLLTAHLPPGHLREEWPTGAASLAGAPS